MTCPYPRRARPRPSVLFGASVSGLVLCCAVGCSSLKFDRPGSLFGAPDDSGASIDGVKGPLERDLAAANRQSATVNMEGLRDYEKAQAMYDQGDFKGAETAFEDITQDYATDESGFFRRRRLGNMLKPKSALQASYYDNPLVEDSLFMLAESRYKQEKLPGAESVYIQLLQQYPNTRHLDKSTERLFDIAMTWMDFKTTTSDEVKVASHSDTGRASKPEVVSNSDYERPSFFNMFDGKRPWTDTEGRALEALKAIWMNDPTGPLADDALMLTASHYLRVGRHAEASETFRMLREEFPDSPHLKDAYVLGSYVTQASYQGAAYEDRSLIESRELKTRALTMFRDLSPEERKRLEEEVYRVDDAAVAREFERSLYYLNKGNFEAVEMYCNYIINKYPQSKYAGKARGLLAKLPEFRKQNTLLLALQGITADDIPSIEDPAVARGPGVAEESPALPPSNRSLNNPEATPQPEETESKSPRYLPSWDMPKLKPIPTPRLWPGQKDEPAEPEMESAPPFDSESQKDSGRVKLTLGEE